MCNYYVYLLLGKYKTRFKIGLSSYPFGRFKEINKHYSCNIEGSFLIPFPNYEDARSFEKLLHKIFKEYRTKDLKKFKGYTEFFSFECLNQVVFFIYKSEFGNSIEVIESVETRSLQQPYKTRKLF
jgi:hypothetical protein